MKLLPLAFILLLELLGTSAVDAALPVTVHEGKTACLGPLGLYLDVLHDPEGLLSVQDVSSSAFSAAFVPSQSKTLNFGFARGAHWLRLQINNTALFDKDLLLEAAFPLIDSIDLYLPDHAAGAYQRIAGGELVGADKRPLPHRNPVFSIPLTASRTQTYYLRYEDAGSVALPLLLWEPDAFIDSVNRQQLLFGLYYGFLLAIILYNLIIYLTVRITSYLYYLLFAAIYLFWQLVYNGLANQYLWPGAPELTHRIMPVLICATGMSALQFARVFLNTKDHVPIVHRFLSLLMGGFAVIALLAINPHFTSGLPLAALTCILFAFAVLFTCLYCWQKGIRPARYFSIAWFGLLCGTALLGLKSFGLLPSNPLTEYGQQAGSLLEIALFSLALADKLRTMRREKKEAQAETLHLQQQANRILEEKVSQRTRDLHTKNQQLQLLATKLAKYLDPQVYAAIFSGRAQVKIHSYRKKLTIFFSDIKGFTELTDTIESEPLSALLNEYLNEMAEIALQYGGTIDKYIGDAIMIFFGDPETRGEAEDALACVRMALAMRHRMKTLQKKWQDTMLPTPLRIRMGINTGFCTVGNFGSENRLDYTIIGGQVNMASRLEANAAPDEILISHQTYALIKDSVACQPKEKLQVKGIAHPVHTYQVLDLFENLDLEKDRIQLSGNGYAMAFDFSRISASANGSIRQTLEKIITRLPQS
jgi:class 3 adenylate cyclase